MRLNRLDEFHPHIGWIAQDDVKARLVQDIQKLRIPIERGRVIISAVDEAVAVLDVVVESSSARSRFAVCSHSASLVISSDSAFTSTPKRLLVMISTSALAAV